MHPAPGQMASMQAFTSLHTPCVPPHCPPLTTVYAVPAARHGAWVLAPCQAGRLPCTPERQLAAPGLHCA